jgi:hypothetical protein
MRNPVNEVRDPRSKEERIRLLEAQAESLRREIHFLHRWREQRTYTASWRRWSRGRIARRGKVVDRICGNRSISVRTSGQTSAHRCRT